MKLHENHPLGPFTIILSGNNVNRHERIQRKVKSFDTVTKECMQYVTNEKNRIQYEDGVAMTTTEVKPHYRAVHKITGKEIK